MIPPHPSQNSRAREQGRTTTPSHLVWFKIDSPIQNLVNLPYSTLLPKIYRLLRSQEWLDLIEHI